MIVVFIEYLLLKYTIFVRLCAYFDNTVNIVKNFVDKNKQK